MSQGLIAHNVNLEAGLLPNCPQLILQAISIRCLHSACVRHQEGERVGALRVSSRLISINKQINSGRNVPLSQEAFCLPLVVAR